jgi:hypothetical protein
MTAQTMQVSPTTDTPTPIPAWAPTGKPFSVVELADASVLSSAVDALPSAVEAVGTGESANGMVEDGASENDVNGDDEDDKSVVDGLVAVKVVDELLASPSSVMLK